MHACMRMGECMHAWCEAPEERVLLQQLIERACMHVCVHSMHVLLQELIERARVVAARFAWSQEHHAMLALQAAGVEVLGLRQAGRLVRRARLKCERLGK